jgi:hypothetical protein
MTNFQIFIGSQIKCFLFLDKIYPYRYTSIGSKRWPAIRTGNREEYESCPKDYPFGLHILSE